MTKYLIVVSGPQGSGKSTQAESIAARYVMPLFEAGVRLRQYVEDKRPGFEEIERYMEKGLLVPHHYLNDLVFDFVRSENCERGLVTDGFPRSLEQWQVIDAVSRELGAKVLGVYISLSEAVALERIKKRVELHNGVAAKRDDDTPDAIKKRLAIYHEETMPVIDYIRGHHQLVEIDGNGTIEEVTDQVIKKLDRILK
jgi:adenylate kinase